MANEEEEEREFLAALKARSGHTLGEWMAAISAQGFDDKNQAIDWLRTQGFPFARASWLERIHANGGRPIYLARAEPDCQSVPDAPARPADQRAAPTLAAAPQAGDQAVGRAASRAAAEDSSQASPPASPLASPPAARATRAKAQLEALLAAGKGYRPLFHLLEGAILKALPDTAINPRGTYIGIGNPREFAAVALNASGLRLGLALGDHPFAAPLTKARLKGTGAEVTHMLVLTDARQVNDELMRLIIAANARSRR